MPRGVVRLQGTKFSIQEGEMKRRLGKKTTYICTSGGKGESGSSIGGREDKTAGSDEESTSKIPSRQRKKEKLRGLRVSVCVS